LQDTKLDMAMEMHIIPGKAPSTLQEGQDKKASA
jgi:hypothetical protein